MIRYGIQEDNKRQAHCGTHQAKSTVQDVWLAVAVHDNVGTGCED